MTNPNTIPGELAAIHERLDSGEERFAKLERAVTENTRITAETAEVTRDIRDALIFARFGTKIIKWLGAVGALAVAVVTLWHHWRK